MAEYIERDKVCELCGAKDIDGCSDECLIFMGNVPAADVVTVVWCKDCMHRELSSAAPFMYFRCTHDEGLRGQVGDNTFCSYGERRGDG